MHKTTTSFPYEKAYRRKYFDKAKQYAELSIKFSEMAEFDANKKQTFNEIQNN